MQGVDAAWDDVRLFLALARGGKLGTAAKELGVDASTMSRRLVSLERRCGVLLFERTRDGLVPTSAGERLVDAAQATEDSALRFFDQLRPLEKAVEGLVRITAPPGVVELVIMPAVGELLRLHPKLRLELDGNESIASLARRETDVAVRFARPEGGGLVIRRVGTSPNEVYVSSNLRASLGALSSYEDVPWIAWDAAHSGLASSRWLASNVKAAPVIRASTLLSQVAGVEASAGVAVLPVLVAARRGLVRPKLAPRFSALPPPAPPADDIYLVCSAALRQVPRIKAVWSFLLEVLLRVNPGAAR